MTRSHTSDRYTHLLYLQATSLMVQKLTVSVFLMQHYTTDHPQVVAVMKNLGHLYKKLKKWEKAASLYRQLVEIREKTQPAKLDPSLATALVNLAVIYCQTVSRCYLVSSLPNQGWLAPSNPDQETSYVVT